MIAGFLVVQFTGSRCYLIDWTAEYADVIGVPIARTQAELDFHIEEHQPALLRDVLVHWPAVRKWTPQWFGEMLSHRDVEIYFWGRSGADWKRSRIFEVTMRQFAMLISNHAAAVHRLGGDVKKAGPAPYLQEDEGLVRDNYELLMPDVANLPFRPYLSDPSQPGGLPEGVDISHAFWMGPPGAKTGIHWDAVNAILHQLHGTKRVTLWPPSARANLYPSGKYNHGAELSLVDASQPNLTRFPHFAAARSISTMLPAGSALFLPAGWWHAVESLDTSISLALRSQSRCELRAAWADDVLRCLHHRGLYKRGDCTCHPPHADAKGDAEAGVGEAVEEALRAAGISVGEAEEIAS